jgi:general secretion pathway protein K
MVERALSYVTVFSKSADVDVLIAPPEVIAALPGMTPEILNDFLKQRLSLPRDQKAIAAALGPVKAGTLPESRAFRVLTTLRFDNGRRTSSEAVISLGSAKGQGLTQSQGQTQSQQGQGQAQGQQAQSQGQAQGQPGQGRTKDEDKEPYSILSWQDQAEITARPLKQAGR